MNFCAASYPRARKPRACAECPRPIKAGERWCRIAGATDGRMWSESMCLPCKSLSEAAWALHGGCHEEDGPRFGELVTWLTDYETPRLIAEAMAPNDAGHFLGLLFARREAAAETKWNRTTSR